MWKRQAGSGPASEQQVPGPWLVLWRAPGQPWLFLGKEEGGLGRAGQGECRAEASRQNARAGEGAAGGGGERRRIRMDCRG